MPTRRTSHPESDGILMAKAPPESTVSSVTFSSDGSSVTLIPVAERDWPVCVIGLELLQESVKKATKASVAIACDTTSIRARGAECSALLERFKEGGPIIKLGIPVEAVLTLRVGLSLEFEQTKKLAEEQGELRLDTEETETRIKQLDRLMSELDVAAMAGSGAA